jgi:hypothetical protein
MHQFTAKLIDMVLLYTFGTPDCPIVPQCIIVQTQLSSPPYCVGMVWMKYPSHASKPDCGSSRLKSAAETATGAVTLNGRVQEVAVVVLDAVSRTPILVVE